MRSFPSVVWHAGILNIAYVDYTQTYNRILYRVADWKPRS